MAIRFENCRKEYRAALRDMFNQHWRADYIAMHPDFFDWQFARNPYIPPDFEDSFLLAFDDERLVGALGLVPTAFDVGGEAVEGTWLSNWLSHPDYRNRGIGVFLLKRAMERFRVVATTSISKFAEPIYRGLDFNYLKLMERLLFVIDPEQVLSLMKDPTPADERLIRELAARSRRAETAESGVEPDDGFPPDVDEFIRRVKPPRVLMAARDRAYLEWRYGDHPMIEYHPFVVRCGGRVEGLAVARIELVRGRSERVGRLLEWFASDRGRPELAARVLGFFRARSCGFVDFFCTSARFATDLKDLGFACESENPQVVVPYLFQPLDHARRGTNFVAWNSLEGKAAEIAWDLERWLVTKGDNDQDRPN